MSGDGSPGHSLTRRFAYKVGANVVGVLLAFFQASIVSRALGPRDYGNYSFLINFFNQFVAFLDMRSSTWLYTSVAGKRDRQRLVRFYAWIAAAISLVAIVTPLLAVALNQTALLWPGQREGVVIVVSLLALTFWYSDLLAKLCDAAGLTVSLEKVRVINSILFFAVLLGLMRWSVVNLTSYLAFQFVTNIALAGALALLLRRKRAFTTESAEAVAGDKWQHLRDVTAYSHPLFVFTLVGLAATYADRWLLQTFGGSIQQGWFSLSLNIGLAFNVFVNALHPLLMREFAVAFEKGDREGAAQVFRRLIPVSYTVSAFLLSFAAVHADRCVRIVGGESYSGAAATFAVLAFSPVIYNYSMLSGSVMYAANRTRLLRNIGLVTAPLSIITTFFMIAPHQYGGLALGAFGLAIKMVGMEFIGNNIVLFFNCRLLGLRFERYLFHQIASVALLAGTAFACRLLADALLGEWLPAMIVGGVLYLLAGAFLFAFVPRIAGVRKEEAVALLREAMARASVPWVRRPPVE